MKLTKTVLKFWSGAYPEKMEKWLEHMESAGWQLVKVHWGGVKFTFEQGNPTQVSYCIDYMVQSDPEYIGLIEDTGWQLMMNSGGWYIWRMPYEEVKPEMYTDIDSLIARNKRLLQVYGILMLTQIPIAVVNIEHFTLQPILIIYIPILSILVIAFFQTLVANRKLKGRKA